MISTKRLAPGWCEVALSEVAEINPPQPLSQPLNDTLVSFIPMAAVEAMSGRVDTSASRTWQQVKKGYTRFQEGDVLFAKITPCMENGKAAIARGLVGGVGAGSTEFHVLRPEAPIKPEILLHYILQEEFRKSARAHMTGTAGQLRVPSRFLDEQTIPLPPTDEQHRIVEAIESYFTRLDDAVATLERVQRNLKRYRASVLKAAVEGRLVPTEAELARAEGRGYEPASVLLERVLAERRRRWEEVELAKMKAKGKMPTDDRCKAKYEEPVVPDTTDLPELSEGWCWASIDQLAAMEDHALCDGPFGSNLKTSHYTANGPRVIRLQNIGEGAFIDARAHISADHYRLLEKHAVSAGDVIVASLGQDLPRACMVPERLGKAIVKADCLRFAVHPSLMLPRFAMHALNSPVARKHAEDLIHGVGRPRIGLTLLRSFPLPLPPLVEQTRIVAEVERTQSVELEVTSVAGANLTRLKRLRQSILKWAFDGRLVDQDPTDEPASKLLERINAGRASEPVRASNLHPRRTTTRGKAR